MKTYKAAGFPGVIALYQEIVCVMRVLFIGACVGAYVNMGMQLSQALADMTKETKKNTEWLWPVLDVPGLIWR